MRALTLSDQRCDALQACGSTFQGRRQPRLDEIVATADTWWMAHLGAIAEATLLVPDAEEAVRQAMGILAEWEYAVLESAVTTMAPTSTTATPG